MKSRDEVRVEILDAAVEIAAQNGIARASVGDVARRVGISRPTLYTHVASKDELVTAAIVREAVAFVDQVTAAAAKNDEPRSALHAGIVAALEAAREHPLLDRVLRAEPEVLLPFLTSDGGPVLAHAEMSIRQVIETIAPGIGAEQIRLLGDLLTRLLVSYSINAPTDSPEVIASTICKFFFEGVLAAHDGVLAATSVNPTTEPT